MGYPIKIFRALWPESRIAGLVAIAHSESEYIEYEEKFNGITEITDWSQVESLPQYAKFCYKGVE
ncbi:hypothetical protein [Culicoidibacter larvae]|uniref:Uncharacterized protein n=1 Tax=Culicoidibacter larvae TaxID=2579976 RepID=A0A5R8Q777_9FIRM|nr:hypothetical protein [Culicoidibacter larvae]TLG71282.1 hypothetical protein FEZ08_11065 [Culicoidibacter larvae]